mmetsp:Transcript_59641/g.167134  ORF Transcript_59641/g.167134 Transcript_59641/m.167134 type:complete len:251 (-) Transcript_59641:328-1080(-)
MVTMAKSSVRPRFRSKNAGKFHCRTSERKAPSSAQLLCWSQQLRSIESTSAWWRAKKLPIGNDNEHMSTTKATSLKRNASIMEPSRVARFSTKHTSNAPGCTSTMLRKLTKERLARSPPAKSRKTRLLKCNSKALRSSRASRRNNSLADAAPSACGCGGASSVGPAAARSVAGSGAGAWQLASPGRPTCMASSLRCTKTWNAPSFRSANRRRDNPKRLMRSIGAKSSVNKHFKNRSSNWLWTSSPLRSRE